MILMKPKWLTITEFNGLLHQVCILNLSLGGQTDPKGMYNLCKVLKMKAQV